MTFSPRHHRRLLAVVTRGVADVVPLCEKSCNQIQPANDHVSAGWPLEAVANRCENGVPACPAVRS